MDDLREIIDSPAIATFEVVRLAYEKFAEIDPKFIDEFYDELPADWKILNENGLTHLLTFNRHKTFPLLGEGWSLFADFYHPPGNVEIIFSYHGSGFFGVKSIKKITGCHEIPPFHSRNMSDPDTALFEIRLATGLANRKKLRLQGLFVDYIHEKKLKEIMVCADDGVIYNLNVIIDKNIRNVKLGNQWNMLCKNNNIKDGDVIRFKFDKDLRCHAFNTKY